MKSHSVSNLQDTLAGVDSNFLLTSPDLAAESVNEAPHPQQALPVILADLPGTTGEERSADSGDSTSAASPFALLDAQSEAGHAAPDSALTAIADTSAGAGSINLIGTPLPETNTGQNIGLHIAPPTDGDFTATTDGLFAPTASLPTPPVSINLANLTPMPFAGQGAGITSTHSATLSLDTHSDLSTPAASTAGFAFLENSSNGPIANSGVGAGGATAAQVRAALDESGLSVNGAGIKVGVLSDSFNNLGGAAADEADGALPSSVQVLSDLASGGTDEGRAMMQIIHDIAPGASLAFYTAFNSEQDFANGILALANAGAKVIVDDVGYFDEPFFQNGVVAEAIQTVEAEGVTYVTAAGNEGGNGYQASWTPISGTFDGVALTDAESFGGSLTQTITVNNEGTGDDIPLVLEWNQTYGAATSNLELLVFHNGTLVGTATNRTSGEPSNPWVEYDFTASGTYQVAVENLSGPNPGLIKEITEGDGLPATISGANVGTVVGHAMTPGAITAGAVSAADTPAFGFTPTSDSFSSSGLGTELLFANNGTALSSPQLLSPVAVSGIDDIATTVPGGLSDFFGTSASSASLAGVAALILSADSSLTPAQVEQIMEQAALSMGNSAVAGAGLAQVNPAVAEALAMITHVIQIDGSTSLDQIGSNYFLDPVGSPGAGPELKFGGNVVTAGQLGSGWVPVGAVQTTNGYDLAWQEGTSNLFSIWQLNSSGAYVTDFGQISGNSTTLENFETIFGQDLNHDGTIGLPPPPPPPPATVIKIDGSTSLDQIGSNYFLDPVGSPGAGPELKFGGNVVTAGQLGSGWVPVGAVQTTNGYDLAWQEGTSNLFSIWQLNSSGAYVTDFGQISGNSTTLENFETIFGQDLNHDGTIGLPPPPPPPPATVIKIDGSTSLDQIGSNYFLDPVGSPGAGPELKFGGNVVTAGQLGSGWVPVGAVQTTNGYDLAWQEGTSNLFSIWQLNSSGAYVTDFGQISGNSTTLENFETIFGQDLNHDGTIGLPSGSHKVATTPATNYTPDNFDFTTDGSGTPQAIAFSVHPNGQGADTSSSAPLMGGHDAFVFAVDPGASNASSAGFASVHAAMTGAHHDAFSNDAAHGLHWLAHHNFHLI